MAVVYVLGHLTSPFLPIVDSPKYCTFLGAHLSERQGAGRVDYQLRVWTFALKEQLETLRVSSRLQIFGRLTVRPNASTPHIIDVAEFVVLAPTGSRKLEPETP